MRDYTLIRDYLQAFNSDRWQASFGEIEAILGDTLPDSAYRYTAWWANQKSEGHSQKVGWMDAGFRTQDLNLAKQQVTFVRLR